MPKKTSFFSSLRQHHNDLSGLRHAVRDYERAVHETTKPAPSAPFSEYLRHALRGIWREISGSVTDFLMWQLYLALLLVFNVVGALVILHLVLFVLAS